MPLNFDSVYRLMPFKNRRKPRKKSYFFIRLAVLAVLGAAIAFLRLCAPFSEPPAGETVLELDAVENAAE